MLGLYLYSQKDLCIGETIMTSIENYVTNKLKGFHNPFYLCVSGNSMVPKINNGDRILVESNPNCYFETYRQGENGNA